MKNKGHTNIFTKKQTVLKRLFYCICNGRTLFYLLTFTYCFFIRAQQLKGTELNNTVRLNYIPVSMPTDAFPKLKPTMGLAGLHYQVPLNNWLYTGAAMHFAVTGDQGGLFTLGTELGFNFPVHKNIYLDGNMHFGGGGGYRYLVNSGGFINSNVGLQFKMKQYSVGVQYSYINFYTGAIKGNSLSFFIEIPSLVRFTNYRKAHKTVSAEKLASDHFWNTPPIKHAQQIRFDFFKPFGNSKKDNGKPLTETLYVMGFEYQKYLNENTFLFAHTDAIYKGLRAGFMDLFIGAGYHPYQSNYMNLFGKIGVGAAGGRISPEGGMTLYPSIGMDINLCNHIAISGHTGYYRAIAGDFEAYTYGLSLKYTGLNGGIQSQNSKETRFYTQGIRIELQNQSYYSVAKTDDLYNAKEIDIQLIGFKVNYDINKWLYLIGEAGFAYDGRSGGYAHGLIGSGVYSPRFFNQKMRGFIELTVGAGGGAGVDTDEGIVTRPSLGLTYDVSDKVSLLSSFGRYYSPFGNVNSNHLNIGLSFNLATVTHKN